MGGSGEELGCFLLFAWLFRNQPTSYPKWTFHTIPSIHLPGYQFNNWMSLIESIAISRREVRMSRKPELIQLWQVHHVCVTLREMASPNGISDKPSHQWKRNQRLYDTMIEPIYKYCPCIRVVALLRTSRPPPKDGRPYLWRHSARKKVDFC